mgnify:CR=1 FL=1
MSSPLSPAGDPRRDPNYDALPYISCGVGGSEAPEPQKWTAMDFGIGDWKRPLVLAFLELPEGERHLPLSALARRYPPPRVETL